MDDKKEKLVELLKIDPCPSPFMCSPECRYSYCDNCFTERFADHLIANGVTVQEWIPVTERLPDTEDRVLVCCKTKKGLQTVNMAYLFNGTWHGQGSMSGVTHWMPLPEPPKGE